MKKKPKRSTNDPRGGFFRMYSELWLNDKELIEAGDIIQAGYVRLMCATNEIDFVTGTFNTNGYPLPQNFICELAKISSDTFETLQKMGKVIKDENGIYAIKNWDKYQDKDRVHGHQNRFGAPHGAQGGADIGSPSGGPNKLRSEEVKKVITEEHKKTSTTPSASPQATFIDWFKIQFQERHGKPYADSQPDYIQMAKVIKAFKGDIETLKKLVLAGWNTPDEKNGFSISSVCMTVKGFCSVVNRIPLQKPRRKTAYEIEQEALNAKV